MNTNRQGIDKDKRILDYERITCCEEMMECLDILSLRYDNINVSSIGQTVLGKSIPMISFGSGKKELLYVGCISGADYITCSLILRFINEYCETRKNNRRIYNLNLKSLEATRTIHILPILNPDGVSYVTEGIAEDNPLHPRIMAMNGGGDISRWAANARGVDLGRNFNYDYIEYNKQDGAKTCGAPSGYAGVHPESEPETSALSGYLRYNDKIRLLLSLECGPESVAYIEDEAIPRGKSIGQSLSRISGKPLVEIRSEEARGSLVGWCSSVLGIPSYTVYCGEQGAGPDNAGYFQKYAGIRELLFTAPVLT